MNELLQEVAEDSLHVLMVNAFLDSIAATALLTVTTAVMNDIVVSINVFM